jgi:AraC-like DNA-binding protein
METIMHRSGETPNTQLLNHEAWRESLRSLCGRYNPEDVDPQTFSGWVRPVNVCGFTALDIGSNAPRIERTHLDARLDSADHFFVLFQVAGLSELKHNDEAVRLIAGDLVLMDSARPATNFLNNGNEAWNAVAINLPRQALVCHLGFDPRGGIWRRGGIPAARLLLDLIRNGDGAAGLDGPPGHSYMQLAVYDLVGALFAPADPWPASRHTEKLFTRICSLTKDRMADPEFGPVELATEAGISLRYAQKLFTARGLSCREFIYSLRLDHATRLLKRRASLDTGQPLREIAYACGFRDYTHFARRFRRRFGYPPGAHSGRRNHTAGP